MVVSSKSFDKNKCFKSSGERECLSDLFKIHPEIRGSTVSHHKVAMDNLSDHDVKMAFPLDEDDCSRIKRKKLRRGLSRVLKAVFFQASSTRKKRSKKVGEETSPHGDDLSTRIKKTFKDKKAPPISSAAGTGENTPFDGSSSNSSSHFTSSSLSSNSRSGSERNTTYLNESNMMKTKSTTTSLKRNCGDYNCNLGLYFLLICFVGLVFCGKAFAICCTVTSLLLFPSQRQVKHVDFPVDFDFDHDLDRRRK